MKSFTCILIATTILTAQATVLLTGDTFDEQTKGKKAIVAFKAPWCGHCKKLKPTWDELSEKVEVLVGEVDCTVEKELCSKYQVQGYPTIKYTTGHSWKAYDKGRTMEALEEFVEQEMKDGCLDDEKLCTEEELKTLEEYKKLSVEDIHKRLDNNKENQEVAELLFKKHVEKLQKQYQTLQEEKVEKLQELGEEEAYLNYVLNLPKEEL